jgi:hypothetical protein
MTLNLPIKAALTKDDTTYSLTADLNNFSAEKIALGQKMEASNIKIQAANQGFQLKGDVKIGGVPASIDYRKAALGADPEIRIQATLDDAARAKFGMDLGSALTGPVPLKVTGKLGSTGDHDNRFNVDADLTASKIDNALPGWVKPAGRAGRAQFSVTEKPQSTRFDDIVIDGSGTLMRGSVELDQNNDLTTAVFPTYQPSDGDRASFKAERGTDGALKVTMRGDVFDGRNFVKSVTGGKSDAKAASKSPDIDVDVKLGAVAGANGESARNIDLKLSRRAGTIRSFSLAGKLGRDANLLGDLRAGTAGHQVLYIEAGDAGAFFRFNDSYPKIVGGSMWMAMDPPNGDQTPQEGLINVRDFVVRGETALDRAANGNSQNGVSFTQASAEFTRQSGELAIRDGVVRGPVIGATIAGNISYASNQVNMRGTFVPLYGINNMFGQIPVLGLFLGGGRDEGLVGITYEVVGPPGAPTLRVNPISAVLPGFTRKIFSIPPVQQPGESQVQQPAPSSSN